MYILYIILIIIFAIFCLSSYYAKKFYNPFQLEFLFGAKGSGKSTLQCKKAMWHIKRGWTVYSDEYIGINGVRIFDINDLGNGYPFEKMSYFIFSEGGICFDSRKFKTFKQSWLEFFKYQRHARCKVCIGSQVWDIDKKIRDLVDISYIVTTKWNFLICARRIGISTAVVPVKDSASGESTVEQTLKLCPPIPFLFIKYALLPRWCKYHNSFTLPTDKVMPFLYEVNDGYKVRK